MNNIDSHLDAMTTDDETAPEGLGAWDPSDVYLPEEQATPDRHPALYNLSAGHLFGGVIRPIVPDPPEYLALDVRHRDLQVVAEVAQWNMLWEAGQFRRRLFDQDDLPEPIASIADMGDINTIFVPRTATRFFEYEPLFHLLPKTTLDRFGLPLLRRGLWPYQADWSGIEQFLPEDFEDRLARAWAWTVWPRLNSGSGLSAFSKDDPIKLLAHNLDFWVPPITDVIEGALREFPEVDKGREAGPVILENGSVLEGAVTGNPRMGGYAWVGEEWADEVVRETVDSADRTGRLQDIIDAVRGHRLEDDFSDRWSFAREDFERKLYRKRNKVQVRFVELTDIIPVQGSESDFADRVVTNDFMALLDHEQREVVVLLASGLRQHEVAERLGYANHGAISKKLSRIRKQAEDYFGLD